jgi:hypothetical protein
VSQPLRSTRPKTHASQAHVQVPLLNQGETAVLYCVLVLCFVFAVER